MAANINRELLFALLIAVPCVFIAIAVVFLVSFSIRAKKKGKKEQLKMCLGSILLIGIAAASWLMNMGWIRVAMTLFLVPFVHSFLFFITNVWVANYRAESKKLKAINRWFCVSYLLGYLLLPDGGDVGGLYVFFGLVQNDTVAYLCEVLWAIAGIVQLVTFVWQIPVLLKTKFEQKRRKAAEELPGGQEEL